jgi:hypothetical protein
MNMLADPIDMNFYPPIIAAFLSAALISKNKAKTAALVLIVSAVLAIAWHAIPPNTARPQLSRDPAWHLSIMASIIGAALLSLWRGNTQLFWLAWALTIAVPLLLLLLLIYIQVVF